MENMPDYSDIIRFAQSPEGRRLIAMLRQTDSGALDRAVGAAKTGDYTGAQSALSGILNTPEARELLKKLGGDHG